MENAVQTVARSIPDQAKHWLGCPVNGYLGSGYGAPLAELLQSPMAAGRADDLVAKALQDVPVLKGFSKQVNVYAYDISMDQKGLVFEVPGAALAIGGA